MSAAVRLAVVGAVAALVSVLPLFDITLSDSWIVQAAIAVAAVAGTGFGLRRLGVPGLLVPFAQLAVLLLWLGLLVASDVAWFGFIPNIEWGTRLVDVFNEGVDTINSYSAPIPVPRGIMLMLVGGAGLVALIVDLVAVWWRKIPLAGVPLAACYTVAASVLPGGLSWWWFLPPAAGFLALLVSEGRTRVAAWGRSASPSAGHSGVPETDSLARNGRRVSIVALAAAVAVPGMAPVLTEGLLGSGRGGGGGGQTIRTDNPIVDLQRNLQRRENVEVLRYRSSADESAYIRIVTLDVFTGEEWKTSNRPVPDSVEGGLPWPQGLDIPEVPSVNYNIRVTDNFSSSWLPLPYPAQAVEVAGDWRYHGATLDVVAQRGGDVRSTSYEVTSLAVQPTVEMLRGAGEPSEDVEPSLELPDELPPMVAEYAAAVTEGATDDFSRAAALQEWFRGPEGGFVYDIEAQPGHSATALTDFLTEKRGYCEQFAAAMAIMARYLGIPARVAVGFTPGDFQGDATWLVRAHDMHAWPELYFEGVGWVRFEPTPATRSGVAPEWTVVPIQGGGERPSTNPVGPTSQPSSSATALPRNEAGDPGAPQSGDGTPSRWPLVLLGLAALLAFFSTPWLAARLGRELRWRRAGSAAVATAEAAWADLREAVLDVGLPWDRAATPRSTGRRVAADASLSEEDRALLDHLVDATERARYARTMEPVPSLRADAALMRRSIVRSQPLSHRLTAFLLPSRLRDAAAAASLRVSEGFDQFDEFSERVRGAVDRGTDRVTARAVRRPSR